MATSTPLITLRPSFGTANEIVAAKCEEESQAERSSFSGTLKKQLAVVREAVGGREQEVGVGVGEPRQH
jgi:hypothetical protein